MPGTYVCFQHELYLWVLLPRKGKEGQRGELQVIRGSPCGKYFWPAVPWISSGTLHLRHGCRKTSTQIFHSRQMVPGRDIWYLPWTGEITQEFQDPTPRRNFLGSMRQSEKSCTHANGVILQLHYEASNSWGCRDQNYVEPRVLREKNPLPYIRLAEA